MKTHDYCVLEDGETFSGAKNSTIFRLTKNQMEKYEYDLANGIICDVKGCETLNVYDLIRLYDFAQKHARDLPDGMHEILCDAWGKQQ